MITSAGRMTRRGFTLIELLVSFAIILILLGLLMPALFGGRRQAKATVSLSNLRQLHASISLYAGDNADYFPYLMTPGEPHAPVVVNGVGLVFPKRQGYFHAGSTFYIGLLDDHADGFSGWTMVHPDGQAWEPPIPSRYMLAHGAFADSVYWTGDATPDDMSLLRGQRFGDVVFPSSKGITLDIQSGVFDKGRGQPASWALCGLGDGSARRFEYIGYDQANIVSRPFAATAFPILSTADGLSGRDF